MRVGWGSLRPLNSVLSTYLGRIYLHQKGASLFRRGRNVLRELLLPWGKRQRKFAKMSLKVLRQNWQIVSQPLQRRFILFRDVAHTSCEFSRVRIGPSRFEVLFVSETTHRYMILRSISLIGARGLKFRRRPQHFVIVE